LRAPLLDVVDIARRLSEESPWRRAQFDTLRLHLVKLAATIVEKKTRIIFTLPASCPQQGLLRLLFDALAPPRPA